MPPQVRRATLEDATKYKIPHNYSLQNWNPDKEPIILLGSVYDANSLGKWIYDWTHYRYGHLATETKVSGALWLLIILLARKLRASAKFISESVGIESVEQGENKGMVEDFMENGEHLMERFRKLLKKCEKRMLGSESKGKNKGAGRLRSDAGVKFAEAIFEPEHYVTTTAGLMHDLEVWCRRWDANCAIVVGAKPDTEQPTDDAVHGDQDSVQGH